PAHRLAGEVDAFLVDGEAALRFRDAAHDVAIADAEILSVAASVRLDDDCGSRVRDRVVSSIDVPPADVLGIRGIEAVQECNQRPRSLARILEREIGATELRRAVDL